MDEARIVLTCRFCGDSFPRVHLYLVHLKAHRHVTDKFPCAVCPETLCSDGALRCHLIRVHGMRVNVPRRLTNHVLLDAQAQICCNVPTCGRRFDSDKDLMRHVAQHIAGGCLVKCIYPACLKKYDVFVSLKSHISKCHRSQPIPRIVAAAAANDDVDADVDDPGFQFEDTPVEPAVNVALVAQHDKTWLNSLAEFYMMLEFNLLIPRSTVQKIADEMLSVHNRTSSVMLAVINDDDLSQEEKLQKLRGFLARCDDGFSELRTSHTRTQFFKDNFLHVTPKIRRWPGNNGDGHFYYHVPIEQTLKKMFASKALALQLEEPARSARNHFTDFYDGLLYKTNMFFMLNKKAFRIILYQDAFEICCPIGPAKGKYKMIGIYLTLGNMPSHLRTHVCAIQLVALCLQEHFNHQKVYGPIVEELKKLESVGIPIDGHGFVKGGLLYISGDNLGSHELGGFNENFSRSRYFCRYCLVDRASFYSFNGHLATFQKRDVNNYNEGVQGTNISTKKGIKFDSKFNELQYFHVTDPGLPPCLGHDLLEGVAAHDVCMYIHHLVEEKKFSYSGLANVMKSFKYSSDDRKDKPLPVSKDCTKVRGGMWQIYNFIRLVPLMLGHLMADSDSPAWELILLMGEILDIVCAPSIHKTYLGHLQSQIVHYLTLRATTEPFRNVPLRPKHHYMLHYPEMILLFGPLGKVWTLRFESKHGFFKDAIRSSKNFKNATFSCSERHELYQAYIRAGGGLRCSFQIFKESDYQEAVYCPEIVAAIRSAGGAQFKMCAKAVVKGTTYIKGSILALWQSLYEMDVTFGRVSLLLVDPLSARLFFLVEVLESTFIPHMRAYKLGNRLKFHCISQDNLICYTPFRTYNYRLQLLVKLKYALVTGPPVSS